MMRLLFVYRYRDDFLEYNIIVTIHALSFGALQMQLSIVLLKRLKAVILFNYSC